MKLVNGNLVKSAIQFAKDNFNIDLDEKIVSDTIKSLSFSDNIKIAEIIKNDDMNGFSELFNMEVEEAITPYAAQNAQQRANSMQNKNANRRANNAQQDANRDATAKPRTVAGDNKQPTGQGAARYDKRADPDDVQRGQNAAQSNANAQGIDRNAQEIERLKALAYGRR